MGESIEVRMAYGFQISEIYYVALTSNTNWKSEIACHHVKPFARVSMR